MSNMIRILMQINEIITVYIFAILYVLGKTSAAQVNLNL